VAMAVKGGGGWKLGGHRQTRRMITALHAQCATLASMSM
jgi:hypothetical protein